MEWLNAKGEKLPGAKYKAEDNAVEAKLRNAISVLDLTPSRDHDGQNLTCQVKSPALSSPLKTSIRLEVKCELYTILSTFFFNSYPIKRTVMSN